MTNANTTPLGNNKRYLVLLDKNRVNDGIQVVRQRAQMADTMRVVSTTDATEGFLAQEQIEQSDVVILDRLGVALVNHPLAVQQGSSLMAASQESDVPILAVVEEENWQAFEEPDLSLLQSEATTEISRRYLEGYRDAVNQLIDKLIITEATATTTTLAETSATWGLQATRTLESPYSGSGIRVAVLDTGMDLNHPDFVGRKIVSKSFIPGVSSAQDGNGHGTHCIGTACGSRTPAILPRYGIAYESEIYAGKVLRDRGDGSSFDIVTGIEWGIEQNCAIISMSLGGGVREGQSFDPFYEMVGDRALDAGSLIVAAAGNDSRRPFRTTPVSSPANCPSFMAVAAVDSAMGIARFSNAGINPNGGDIDIAGPGVDVYSSYPMSTRYERLNGTSMATPHVAGIAALYAQATGSRGQALWNLLLRNAQRLALSSRDVGSGLVQAPR
ncbi:MAG: S8 family serine peptidase [Cyanobacteria bacterium P01_G01_bin.39]